MQRITSPKNPKTFHGIVDQVEKRNQDNFYIYLVHNDCFQPWKAHIPKASEVVSVVMISLRPPPSLPLLRAGTWNQQQPFRNRRRGKGTITLNCLFMTRAKLGCKNAAHSLFSLSLVAPPLDFCTATFTRRGAGLLAISQYVCELFRPDHPQFILIQFAVRTVEGSDRRHELLGIWDAGLISHPTPSHITSTQPIRIYFFDALSKQLGEGKVKFPKEFAEAFSVVLHFAQ